MIENTSMHHTDLLIVIFAGLASSFFAAIGWLSPDVLHVLSVCFFALLGGFLSKLGQDLYLRGKKALKHKEHKQMED